MRNELGRGLVGAAVCVKLAETVVQDVLQPELLLCHEPPVVAGIGQYQVEHAADARGGRDLYRRPQPSGHDLRINAIDVILFAELTVLQSGHRRINDDHVLQRLRHRVFEDMFEGLAIVIELETVHQQPHLFTVPGIPDGLVIHRDDTIAVSFAERAESARRVERFVTPAVDFDLLEPFQRQHVRFLAVDDSLAQVAVFVDQPVGRPGQRILQHVVRMLGQRADPEFHRAQLVEMLDQLVGRNRDETGRQATLWRKYAVRACGELAHGLGDRDVLGQVEIV